MAHFVEAVAALPNVPCDDGLSASLRRMIARALTHTVLAFSLLTACGGAPVPAVPPPAAPSPSEGLAADAGMAPLVVAAPAKSDAAAPSSPADPWGNCPFPPEADTARINYSAVQLVVSIDADGNVRDAKSSPIRAVGSATPRDSACCGIDGTLRPTAMGIRRRPRSESG
jgi:hypothetical protein